MHEKACGDCDGSGYIVVPVCCGKPRTVWGCDPRTGDPVAIGEDCCGSPDPAHDICSKCNGAGRILAEGGNDAA